ncbi:hypothetical protein FKM82_021561 [Ascaphus truei]
MSWSGFLYYMACGLYLPLLWVFQLLDPPQKEQLLTSLSSTEQELRQLNDIPWLWQSTEPGDEEGALDYSKLRRSSRFRLVSKFKKEKNTRNKETRSSTVPAGKTKCA